ncbi:MAG: DUF6596 domain-containing protein [Caldimonas sp.]
MPPDAIDTANAARAAENAARRSYGKLIAFLAARTRDVAGAEDALAEAFAIALSIWPRDGVPQNPEAWLLTVARRREVDALRRRLRDEDAAAYFGWLAELDERHDTDPEVPDRRLELLFACAHPAIDPAVRAPLMLQAVLGFDAATIASAFLVAPATMSQRLVRAKTKIRQAGIGFRVPEQAQWPERLSAVLDAVYAAYAEGWSDGAGLDPQRRNLADEAIWLGQLVVLLMPEEPEALGLLALMLYAHARRVARRDAAGNYVPLAEQDTRLWDAAMIDEAEGLLRRAATARTPGRFQLEAAVQSAHCAGRRSGTPDAAAVLRLYEALDAIGRSPVAALNCAVARAAAEGPAAAWADIQKLEGDPRLAEYQPYWAARADLLARLGRGAEAAVAYQRAIGLERDPAVRRFLEQRAQRLGTPGGS